MFEAWSIKFLFMIYTLLGVKDIPEVPSPDWEIVERWQQQSDGTYRLHIKSNTLPNICKDAGYVVFPQIYYGMTEIFADQSVIYTNSTEKRWNLTSVLARPILNCTYLKNAKEISLFMSSKTFYFASMYKYPFVLKSYPISQFFYEQIYIISGLIALILGFLGWYFFTKISMKNHAHAFLMYNLGFTVLMYAHIPSNISDIKVEIAHSLVFLSLNCILIYFSVFTFDKILIKYVKSASAFFLAFCIAFLLLSNGSSAIIHALMVTFLFVAIAGVAYMVIYKIKNGVFYEKILYSMLFVFTVKDCYMSQLTRDGFLYLSIILVITTLVGFLKVLDLANKKRAEAELVKIKLSSESKILEKISYANDLHREIIHDLKSPLSALEFSLRSVSSGNVAEVSSRIKKILNRINSDEVKKNFDWYSVTAIERMVNRLLVEKKLNTLISYKDENVIHSADLYADPLDLEICVSELLDNAIKNSRDQLKIQTEVVVEDYSIIIKIQNPIYGNRIDECSIGQKGFTETGSGLGLQNVKKKMLDMGGEFKFEITNNKFTGQLRFKKK